jgi:hypothetical protein
MGTAVFIVFQCDNIPGEDEEIMGQVLSKKDKYPISWVLKNSFYGSKATYTMEYSNRNVSNLMSESVRVGYVKDADYKKIAVIGLLIVQPTPVFLDPTNTMFNQMDFPSSGSLEALSDAEGLSIRGNRFLYEVRIYPPNSIVKEDMNSIWQEIHATYNT